MIKHSRFVLAVALTGTLALSACGGGGGGGTAAPDGPVELTFWHSASGAAAGVIDKAVADFNTAHAGKSKVTAIYQGTYDDAITKLANAVQAKNIPDLMQFNDVNTPYMIDTKLTVSAKDLNDAASTKVNVDNFMPVVSRYYTIDGSMRSVPFQVSQPALFLNPDLVKAAGLNPATPPTTIAEMTTWAKQIKEKSNKAGFVFHINPWWFEELTASAGLDYCTPDNGVGAEPATKFVLTDPAQVAQWKGIQELYQSKAAVNVGGDGNAAQTSFANGDAAMLLGSSSVWGNVTKNAKFTPVVAPLPLDSPEGGAVPGGNSVWVFGTDAKGAKEQAAWEVAAYLAGDTVQADSFTTSGYLPNTKSAAEKVAGSVDANQKVLLTQLADAKTSNAAAGCHSGALQSVRTELSKAMESALVGGTDVATALKGIEDQSSGLIEAYNKRAGK